MPDDEAGKKRGEKGREWPMPATCIPFYEEKQSFPRNSRFLLVLFA